MRHDSSRDIDKITCDFARDILYDGAFHAAVEMGDKRVLQNMTFYSRRGSDMLVK